MSPFRVASAALLLILGALPLAAQPLQKTTPVAVRHHAILVGCSTYLNLGARAQLQGPPNDVNLMKQTLMRYFDFTEKDIVTLSENAGAKELESLPTRANIEREFRRLAEVAKEGETVFILLGGHGSQQPDWIQGKEEPEGVSEIFLPRDVGNWEANSRSVRNAILTKDFDTWIQKIEAKKATICLVFDTCFSGAITRGNGTEQIRHLDPLQDLKIPNKVMKVAIEKATLSKHVSRSKTHGLQNVPSGVSNKGKKRRITICAAQPDEPTIERPLPFRTSDAKSYGLLTYTLCEVLSQSAINSLKPMTYQAITQRVHQHYIAAGRTFPCPMIAGENTDGEFLGHKVWNHGSTILLSPVKDGLTMNAGSLHGLTPGSILAVYPPVGNRDQRLGHVIVKTLRIADADVEAVAYENMQVVANLPRRSECRVVFVDYGDLKLRVAVDPQDQTGKEIPEKDRKILMEFCRQLSKTSPMLEPVDKIKDANWLIRPWGIDSVVLVPSSGWVITTTHVTAPLFGNMVGPTSYLAWDSLTTAARVPAFGPAKIDRGLGEWLRSSLTSIARVENLKTLASGIANASTERGLKIDVEMRIADQPTKWPDTNLVVFDQDRVEILVKNSGSTDIDITLLFIASDYGIDGIFPLRDLGDYHRLAPGEQKKIRCQALSAKTTGQEHLVLITVKGADEVVDFMGLAQPRLQRMQELTARGKRRSPLLALLERGAFGEGNARGLNWTAEPPLTMKLITWQLLNEKRPNQHKK